MISIDSVGHIILESVQSSSLLSANRYRRNKADCPKFSRYEDQRRGSNEKIHLSVCPHLFQLVSRLEPLSLPPSDRLISVSKSFKRIHYDPDDGLSKSFSQQLFHPPSASFQHQKQNRSRRSYSSERTVEILLVTDRSMFLYHGNALRNYVFTLMAMVS